MFCEECGTKNAKGAKFCENCGAKLNQDVETLTDDKEKETKEKKSTPKKVKKQNKSNKKVIIICVIVAVILIALIVTLTTIKNSTKPETVVKEYIEAVQKKDYDTLYTLADYDKSEFLDKNTFKAQMANNISNVDIINYNIAGAKYDPNGYDVEVTANILYKGTTDTITLNLTKTGKKKLFYDTYRITNSTAFVDTIKDYKLCAPTGSKIKFNGKQIPDSYKVKDSTYDYCVKLPEIFKYQYPVETTLNNGVTLKDKISTYRSLYYPSVEEDDFPSNQLTKMEATIKTGMTKYFDGLKSGKSFKEIGLQTDGNDIEKLYENAQEKLKDEKINSYEIEGVKVKSIDVLADGTYEVYYNFRYKYNYTYKDFFDEEQTRDVSYTSTYNNYYIVLSYKNNDYQISSATRMPSLG